MAENTAIEWADHTFNPWVGCTKVSPGCDHCYAESWAKRAGKAAGVEWGGERRRTSEANWRKPLHWNRLSEQWVRNGGPRARVFCASLADVFDNQVPDAWREDLFELIRATPHLDWLLLTKRIGNAEPMIRKAIENFDIGYAVDFAAWPWPNVWIGATVTDQAEADRDVPKLLQVPARVRFLSIEPMLGPIDLTRIELHKGPFTPTADAPAHWRGLKELAVVMNALKGAEQLGMEPLSWVICGGESGPGARPMHPGWARSLRDQCAAAGVPFLFKQWGEWAHVGASGASSSGAVHLWGDGCCSWRVGKKAAGRQLDGRTHDGFPASRKGHA